MQPTFLPNDIINYGSLIVARMKEGYDVKKFSW